LRIGAGANERGADYLFAGRIDEVAVYGTALSASSVQAHTTAAGAGSPPPQNQPPVAVVGADRSGGVAPVTVAFDGSGSSDPDGSVASYAWDLDGDGQFDDSTAQKPSWQYVAAGSYAVRLRVTDNVGAQAVSAPFTVTVTSASSSGYSGAVLADGPVGYWRLGEAGGSAAGDASGSGRSGSYLGSPSLGQPGALVGDSNTAVGLDGVGQYVSVPFAAAVNPGQFSVEAWAYVTGGSGRWRAVVSSRDIVGGLNRGYILYAAPDDTWRFWVGAGGSGWNQVYGPTLAPNTWTHLVGTYDGVTARLYVNGVLAASSPYSYVANTARPLRIGAGANERGADYLFAGRIDEVAVYGTALSASSVQAHTTAGRG
jgi:PKD repeat protein